MSYTRFVRQQRLLVKVFILTSIFWISVDFLLFLSFLNNQLNLFDSENLMPNTVKNNRRSDYRKFLHKLRSSSYRKGNRYEAFDVVPGLGKLGVPAKLPQRLEGAAKMVFDNHSFNVLLSDRISLDRKLQDVRGPK